MVVLLKKSSLAKSRLEYIMPGMQDLEHNHLKQTSLECRFPNPCKKPEKTSKRCLIFDIIPNLRDTQEMFQMVHTYSYFGI